MTAPAAAPPAPSFAAAARYWLKLGFISFGGPAGQIALMHQELVERRRWISEGRYLHALNYCMVLPGPEAQQLATYIGWLLHGRWGGLVAGGLFVLPSLLILIGLSWLYLRFGETTLLQGVLYGIRPAVTALVLFAAWRIGSKTLRNRPLQALALGSLLALLLGAPFPAIILLAGLLGLWWGRVRPQWVAAAGGHGSAGDRPHPPALIDDHTPPPARAAHPLRQAVRIGVLGSLLVIAGVLLLRLWPGVPAVLGAMALFFTQAALLTFGGAYAVLPYVYQGAVHQFGWLSGPQMMDGLALGETTPGPLIMVVAFVGFVGGWQAPGGDASLAVLGAVVATLFTFLPSFLFIFAGAPIVEASRQRPRLSAPLTAITAAVVGVIVSLALFFGRHTLWVEGRLDGVALALTVLAWLALQRYGRSPVQVILVCAGLGVLLGALRP
ncbi:MAG TPA: chromate efflux transporter [Nevskiaceae bacterium]|nr:chromate efflux transporter [Nevskiaceae bacterium]